MKIFREYVVGTGLVMGSIALALTWMINSGQKPVEVTLYPIEAIIRDYNESRMPITDMAADLDSIRVIHLKEGEKVRRFGVSEKGITDYDNPEAAISIENVSLLAEEAKENIRYRELVGRIINDVVKTGKATSYNEYKPFSGVPFLSVIKVKTPVVFEKVYDDGKKPINTTASAFLGQNKLSLNDGGIFIDDPLCEGGLIPICVDDDGTTTRIYRKYLDRIEKVIGR